ncbi:MAG: serine hydrolase [Candidatus Pacebacteria bacterium]|nr:serine hydrolase [Candidatus Paceibacterota bacterium]
MVNHAGTARSISLLLSGVLVGLCAGVFLGQRVLGGDIAMRIEDDLVEHAKKGVYTNPLLACGDLDSLSVGAMQTLKKTLEGIIENRRLAGHVSHVSVYVRDLNNGPWLGINERESFYPASLLKVPLLMATYKAAEDRPGFMESTLTFSLSPFETVQLFPPKEKLEQGKNYTVQELLERAIVFSDNDATALLAVAVGAEPALEVFEDFGIAKPSPNADYQMQVRNYASFFRVLYNASYLNRTHSEEALSILARVDFPDGLLKGVPKGVPVAHKFGEREGTIEGGDYQLHDCGIVYTNNPYLICVMAQGKSTQGMLEVIALLSKEVYETINTI